jgi:hypothetical protein
LGLVYGFFSCSSGWMTFVLIAQNGADTKDVNFY